MSDAKISSLIDHVQALEDALYEIEVNVYRWTRDDTSQSMMDCADIDKVLDDLPQFITINRKTA